ncbi:MAG: hypothetical protein HC932_00700 [Thermales bacterium]|nr:hypothetical protein [Thermales bacterium]
MSTISESNITLIVFITALVVVLNSTLCILVLCIDKIIRVLSLLIKENKLNLILLLLIGIIILLVYPDQTLQYISDPPDSVFTIGIFGILIGFYYFDYIRRLEAQEMLTKQQIDDLRVELTNQKEELKALILNQEGDLKITHSVVEEPKILENAPKTISSDVVEESKYIVYFLLTVNFIGLVVLIWILS